MEYKEHSTRMTTKEAICGLYSISTGLVIIKVSLYPLGRCRQTIAQRPLRFPSKQLFRFEIGRQRTVDLAGGGAQTLHVFLQFQRRTEHVGDLLRQIANRNLPARAKIDYFADRQQPRNRVEDVVEIPSRQQITHFEDDEAALPV